MINKKYINFLIGESLKKNKEESKEATSTGGFGYSSPAFSLFSKDEVTKNEYKRSPIKIVREGGLCDSCGEFDNDCICPKKTEATEATDSSSVGMYDTNSFEDINMKSNTTKGRGRSWKKPQIKGGNFVSVKKKCKTFPYCNQGDINSLNISKTAIIDEAIRNVSFKINLSEDQIKKIILSSLYDYL